jgi:23S rRNA pseudouridine1911/1915/1917 synthase
VWDGAYNVDDYIPKSSGKTKSINLIVKNEEHSLTATSDTAGQRLDKYLLTRYNYFTRSHLQTLIVNGDVRVNNRRVKTGYKIRTNDRITIQFKEPQESQLTPENIPFNILYEDQFLLVIDKPAGLVVHPGAGNRSGTLVNGLLFHCKNLSGINGILRPGIVHRLDKYTSGLMVVAKTDESHVFLSHQFETRDIVRTYHTLVWGVPEQEYGEIETQIDRSRRDRKKMAVSYSHGRKALTHYKILRSYQYFALLELILKTGRTHQIRVHLNHINHPVFGDPDYNGRKTQLYRLPSYLRKRGIDMLNRINRQTLHAKKLSFIHPKSNERMYFESDLAQDIQDLLEKLPQILLLNDAKST